MSYPKFAGMTGTAKTAEAEFESLYNLPVKVIPTNKKIIEHRIIFISKVDSLKKLTDVKQIIFSKKIKPPNNGTGLL